MVEELDFKWGESSSNQPRIVAEKQWHCVFSRPSYIATLIEKFMSLTDSKHNGNSMGSTHKHDRSITGQSQCPEGKFCSITAEGKWDIDTKRKVTTLAVLH